MHEPLDLTPALVRKKSIIGSSSVPPQASYCGHKVNNSVSAFQPEHPVRNTSLLTGPIKEIQTLRIDGSLVQMCCSPSSETWGSVEEELSLGDCHESVQGPGLHHWHRALLNVVSCSVPAAESLQKGKQRSENASFTF